MSSSQPPTNNHPNKNEHGGPRPQGDDSTDNVRYLNAVAGNARPHVQPPAQSRRAKLAEAVGMIGRALLDVFVLLTRAVIVSAAFVVAVYIVVALLFTSRAHNHSDHTYGGHTRGAGSAQTTTKPTAAERAVTAAVAPAAFHTPTTPAATSDRPDVGRSLVTATRAATRATAGRDDCRTERRSGRDRAVIGAGPVEIAIDTRVADCADRARSRDSADRDDRDCPCDRDRSGRERSRYRDRDREPVIYLPADPSSYPGRAYPRDSYPSGYYPREGYRGDDGPGDRPGHVCRRVRPGEHPDLPDGGLICLPADRAPRGW